MKEGSFSASGEGDALIVFEALGKAVAVVGFTVVFFSASDASFLVVGGTGDALVTLAEDFGAVGADVSLFATSNSVESAFLFGAI